ncbi:site-specific recombinase, phage integrase family [Rubellimicrobium mesophilum DSM 19309]|uniref:Site-specific recombinase, phage integrase family n=1 Tax=Rubellimicrobium mesophilum DSM 19309 TaxID=442562 RepID=A0A017HRW7_9RHOB|nr:site-specific recombinase, phage integrase family [Rubellimicrobium mesophilum DSM 19309]
MDPSGSRYWVQRIAIRGKRTELGIGNASLVSLVEAREAALANRKLARAGGDPLAAKRAEAAVMTFEEAARTVHRMHLPIWKNPKHAAQFLSSLETYAFPRIGGVRMNEVSSADVLDVLTPLWAEKVDMARRVRQRIGMVMKWGVAKGWRKDNPAENVLTGLPKQGLSKEPRKALPYQGVADCIAAIRTSRSGLSPRLALEFLILTASRSGETREATWPEIDLKKAVWEIPAERMKMKRAHRVPLSPRALEVLREARGLSEANGLVFPGSRPGQPMRDKTLSQVIRVLGFSAHVHGFRTSFRTWAQERTNFPREVAEFALAHVVGSAAEQAYARSDLFEKRRKMMEAWAAYLAQERGQVVRIG